MSHQLNFEKLISYNANDDGIDLEVKIIYSETTATIHAKIDTGATYSIFERRYAEELGLDLESGMRQRFAAATGSFYAYGFRVTMITADLEFDSMVFFAEDESFSKNVLGRITWLDNLILGLVDYEGKIYLDKYDQ